MIFLKTHLFFKGLRLGIRISKKKSISIFEKKQWENLNKNAIVWGKNDLLLWILPMDDVGPLRNPSFCDFSPKKQ